MQESEQESSEEKPLGVAGGDGAGAQQDGEVVVGLPDTLAKLVAAQGPSPEIEQYINRPMPALLVVSAGPSGVGKDVTLQRMRELGVPFHYVVTVTTRERRAGEIDGVHYKFVTKQEYQALKDGNRHWKMPRSMATFTACRAAKLSNHCVVAKT